jgi:YfiH family protein
VSLLRSEQLAFARHGFSTRQGGVSTGRYASLNVGAKWGDDAAHVAENRRRLAVLGGFDLERLFTAKQVHGARVALVVESTLPERVAASEADVVVTAVPGAVVGVYTADCVPLLLGDGEGRVAAVHAGWRGTVKGAAVAGVEALVSIGARRERLRAALGPSICADCFEVGEEVAAEFAALTPTAVQRQPGRRPHVDLRAANVALLAGAGVVPERIDAAAPCTRCEAERFFSFRRDGAGIGQQLSFIVAGDGAAPASG